MKINQILKRLDALKRAINIKHLILPIALLFISVTSCADTITIGSYTWSYIVSDTISISSAPCTSLPLVPPQYTAELARGVGHSAPVRRGFRRELDAG